MPILLLPGPFLHLLVTLVGYKLLSLARERYATHVIQPIYEGQCGRATTVEEGSEAQKG